MRLLVSGITGQLGAGLLEVAAARGIEVVPVIREKRGVSVEDRVLDLLADHTSVVKQVVAGDVTLPNWGIDVYDITERCGKFDAVVNLAALTDWCAKSESLNQTNIGSAVNGLDLAESMRKRGHDVVFSHASSVYSVGSADGLIEEAQFTQAATRTAYEQSKFLAEQALFDRSGDVPVLIGRLTALIGSWSNGETLRRNSYYLLADHWRKYPGGIVPLPRSGRIDMLPRDMSAALLLDATEGQRAIGTHTEIVHIAAGESAPTTVELLRVVQKSAAPGERKVPRVFPLPARPVRWMSERVERTNMNKIQKSLLMGMRYFALDRVFDRTRLGELIDEPLPVFGAVEMGSLVFDGHAPQLATA